MIWIAGIVVICLGVCMPLYKHYKSRLRLPLACAYKSLGTLSAFLAALVATIRLDPHCWFCAAAILLYAAADTVLEFNFVLGAGVFLAGHIFNIAFFMKIAPVSVFHLIGFLLLGALSGFVFWRWRKQIGKQMPAFMVYGVVLMIMCISALACFMTNTLAGILIACGGALFYISDFVLLRETIFPSPKRLDWIVMITYYSSVLLFGISCLLM